MNNDCNICAFEERIKRLEEDSKQNLKEHQTFKDEFKVVELANQKHDMLLDAMNDKLDKIDAKLEKIESKSNENVDYFKRAVISAIGSAVGAGIISALLIYLPH